MHTPNIPPSQPELASPAGARLDRFQTAICLLAATLLSACTTAMAGPPSRLVTVYTVQAEETLPEIGRRHGLGYVEMLAANPGVDPFVPEVGAMVALPTMHLPPQAPPKGIVVNIADMRLYYWPEGEQAGEQAGLAPASPTTYPIGIGREELTTPPGETKIVRKVENPTWYPTARMRREDPTLPRVVGPGPDNPLGTHALYLDVGLLRIHGTNRPWGVGARASSGCIRLYPEDIPVLFGKVPKGTAVRIVDQEVKAGWHEGGLYVEVQPAPDQADAIEFSKPFERRLPKDLIKVVADAAGDPDAVVIDWDKVREAGMQRLGYPVLVGVSSTPRPPAKLPLLMGAVY